jgi:hypothetical protein
MLIRIEFMFWTKRRSTGLISRLAGTAVDPAGAVAQRYSARALAVNAAARTSAEAMRVVAAVAGSFHMAVQYISKHISKQLNCCPGASGGCWVLLMDRTPNRFETDIGTDKVLQAGSDFGHRSEILRAGAISESARDELQPGDELRVDRRIPQPP